MSGEEIVWKVGYKRTFPALMLSTYSTYRNTLGAAKDAPAHRGPMRILQTRFKLCLRESHRLVSIWMEAEQNEKVAKGPPTSVGRSIRVYHMQ